MRSQLSAFHVLTIDVGARCACPPRLPLPAWHNTSQVKDEVEKKDEHHAAGARAAEESALKAILGNISKDKVDKLIQWKHTVY